MKFITYTLFFYFLFFNIIFAQDVSDLKFYEKFVDITKINLNENYGKGCLLKSSNNQNFREAKRFLKKLYPIYHPYTFYCNCKITFDSTKEKLIPIAQECGYKQKSKKTEWIVNWEHIMPASKFGKTLTCWNEKICSKDLKKYKGRKCCEEVDDCFNIMEGDVHNLVPTVYELNHDRKDYEYGIIEGEKREYGNCDFEINNSKRIAEPKEDIRGDIARAYLYMSWFYKIKLTANEKKWIEEWNLKDPPSEIEKQLNTLKAKFNLNENPFITYYIKK